MCGDSCNGGAVSNGFGKKRNGKKISSIAEFRSQDRWVMGPAR